MKHSIKKAVLAGAFSCFLLGSVLADGTPTTQATKPVLARHSSRCRKQRAATLLVHDVRGSFYRSFFPL